MDFKLPDIGEGVAEGEIVKWHVAEGERVKEDQLMVEVMTDKATVQITAPTSGVIRKIRCKEGEVAKVHSVLVEIAEEGAKAVKAEEPEKREPAKKEPEKAVSKKPLPPTAVVEPAPMMKPEIRFAHPGKALAAPATRKLAREKGIDIATVIGSGPAGRVTKEDVIASLSGGRPVGAGKVTGQQTAFAPAPEISERPTAEIIRSVPKPGPNGESREPLRGIRKKIAEHMRQSKDRAAHFSYVDEVDMTEVVELREETKKEAAAQGVKLSFLPFIIKATVAALKEYPMLNATLDEAKGEIVYKYYYNIGVAVATDKGLVVPVVKEADKKNIIQIAREMAELSDKARAGK
ncbi:MAG: 2-oxo acid dehydrogenase subunit E2, partial [Deltaproteobacteria bacterium]|nr:2-oxo acid dehydrogenase subunit E2 [Deltaproteobacteria bacterium]